MVCALVLMAAGAVDVAVFECFVGGFADFFDGHVKVEGGAGEQSGQQKFRKW